MSRRPRSRDADIDLIARPDNYISYTTTYASGALNASIDRYMLLKNGATNRLNRRLLIGHPERWAWRWHAKHDRWVKRRGWRR